MDNTFFIENIIDWWKVFFFLFSFVALYSIWLKLPVEGKSDKGLMYLSFSILAWFISGVWSLYHTYLNHFSDQVFEKGIAIISIINSGLILLSIPWFTHRPNLWWFNDILKTKAYRYLVYTATFFFIFSTCLSLNQFTFASDFCFSVVTIILLGTSLFITFKTRGLFWIAILTVLVMIVTGINEFIKLGTPMGLNLPWISTDFLGELTSILFTSFLTLLFFALAYSFLTEIRSVHHSKKSSLIFIPKLISLDQKNNENFYIVLSITDMFSNQFIKLTPANFNLLCQIAIPAKYNINQGIFPMKIGEKKIQNIQIDRIVESILKQLDNHTTNKRLLKHSLFSNAGEKKGIKLNIEPSSIISRTPLEEIVSYLNERTT